MINLGTVKPGSTIYIPFDTFDGGTGASITMSGLAATDIEVYKDGGTTQRASDNGYTLLDTDGIDFDGITGIHGFSIDLADNSTAGFWAAGSRYFVVVSTITVDAQTVSFIAAIFTIGIPDAVLNTTIATLSSQTSFTLTSGPAEDDALNGCVVYIHDVASAVQGGFAVVSDYTGSTKTVTLAAGTTFTAAATDNIAVFAPANVGYWASSAVAAVHTAGYPVVTVKDGTGTGEIDTTSGGVLVAALATDSLTSTAMAGNMGSEIAAYVWAEATRTITGLANNAITAASLAADAGAEIADAVWDEAASGHVTAGTFGQALGIVRANTAQAGAGTTITLDASASAVDDFYNNTIIFLTGGAGAGQARIISDYVGATKVATVPTWATNPDNTTVFVILPFGSIPGASAPTAAEVADAVWDEATAGHTTSGSFGEQLKTDVDAILADTGTDGVIVASLATNSVTAAALAADAVTEIQSGLSTLTAAGVRTAVGLASANLDTQLDALPTAAENAAAVWDEARSGHTISGTFGQGVASVQGNVTGSVGSVTSSVTVGTNNDKTGYALSSAGVQAIWDALTSALSTASSIGKLLVDNINATISSRASQTSLDTLDDYVDTEVAAIKAKTDNLPSSPAAVGSAMTLTSGERNSVADALLDRDMSTGTDSGSATVRTVRQALRFLRNKWSVTNGTLTITKEDDSTASWTAAVTTTAGDPVSTVDPASS